MRFIEDRRLLFSCQTIFLFMFLVNTSFPQRLEVPKNWKRYDLELFSFSAPSDLISEPFEGKDSSVWKYNNKNLKLIIDLGLYSAKPEEDKFEKNYREESIKIGKKKATIVFFKFRNSNLKEFKNIAAVYFYRVGSNKSKMSIIAYCRTQNEQKLARKIFMSVKFY